MSVNQVQVTKAAKSAAQQNLDDFLDSVNAHINGDWSKHASMRLYDLTYDVESVAADQPSRASHSIVDAKRLRLSARIGDSEVVLYIPVVEVGDGTGGGPDPGAGSTPTVLLHPESQSKQHGSTVSISVTAGGSEPLLYQWRKDGAQIVGEESSTLTITNFQAEDAGSYTVIVYNSFGRVESNAAVLSLLGSSSSSSSSWDGIIP